MSKYNYCYNFGFFGDWLASNPQFKRYGILSELGMSDYRTLQNWMEGKTIMPITQMMKFCNIFGVPLTAFFYDEYADENSVFAKIQPDAIIEPVGGWKTSERRVGIKVGDPRTSVHHQSTLPLYCKRPIIAIQDECETTDKSGMPQKERMRFLDIIEQQNKQIMDLTREIITLRSKEQLQ